MWLVLRVSGEYPTASYILMHLLYSIAGYLQFHSQSLVYHGSPTVEITLPFLVFLLSGILFTMASLIFFN
jgi:hypothetical protein